MGRHPCPPPPPPPPLPRTWPPASSISNRRRGCVPWQGNGDNDDDNDVTDVEIVETVTFSIYVNAAHFFLSLSVSACVAVVFCLFLCFLFFSVYSFDITGSPVPHVP